MAHRIMNKDLKAAKHPTFEVFTKQGRLKPHLRRAFVETIALNYFDVILNEVAIKDGSYWQLIMDEQTEWYISNSLASVRCILSCQEDWQGNKIAVVRLYKDKDHGINIS